MKICLMDMSFWIPSKVYRTAIFRTLMRAAFAFAHILRTNKSSSYIEWKLLFIIYLLTLYLKLEKLHSSEKNLQSNLYQLKKNEQAAETTTKQTTTKKKKTNKKIMFNKHWSDVTVPSEIKPTCWIYVLHKSARVFICFPVFNFWFKRWYGC